MLALTAWKVKGRLRSQSFLQSEGATACMAAVMQVLGKARLGSWRAQISIRFQRDVFNTWSFAWTNDNTLQDLIGKDQRKVQQDWHCTWCPLQISSWRRGVRRILPLKAGRSSMIVGTGTHQDLDPQWYLLVEHGQAQHSSRFLKRVMI